MITRTDLMKETAKRANLTQKEVKRIFDVYQECFYDALKTQDDIRVFEGVTFTVKEASPRVCRHPKTGGIINVPAKKKLAIRTGVAVNNILADMK